MPRKPAGWQYQKFEVIFRGSEQMSTQQDKAFDAELMNFDGDRYDVVVLASIWAKELKKKGRIQKPTQCGGY